MDSNTFWCNTLIVLSNFELIIEITKRNSENFDKLLNIPRCKKLGF